MAGRAPEYVRTAMAVLTRRALFLVFLVMSLVDVTGAVAALSSGSHGHSILLLAAVAFDMAVLHRLWSDTRTEAG